MTTIEQRAREWAEEALIFHWQTRVRAEKENKAPFGQITTVKDCYEYGFTEGIREGLKAAHGLLHDKISESGAHVFDGVNFLLDMRDLTQAILDGKIELKEASGDD